MEILREIYICYDFKTVIKKNKKVALSALILTLYYKNLNKRKTSLNKEKWTTRREVNK